VSGGPAPRLRVVIVDDHPMFRLGLAAAIAEMEGIDLAGEATCGADVAALVASTEPDVVLLDMRLPDVSGLDVNRWLAEHHPFVRVLILTMSEDLDSALTALHDGAGGYLVKGADADRVEQAIRTVTHGDVVLDNALVPGVIERTQSSRAAADRPFPQLTDREYQVLELIAEGLNNTEIARRLVVNPKTARNHVSNVFAKIHVDDRPGAIVLAHRHGVGN
jgi:DNA-binding NarL/FixJ family response regulator